MRFLFGIGILFTLAIMGTGCSDASATSGPAGGAPVMRTAVGPIPGYTPPPPAPQNPFGLSISARTDGRKLFGFYNCGGCHGDHGGGGMGPSLRDESWIYGNSDSNIFGSIAEGRAHGMPAWGVKLPEEQIWKLVAYIHSFRTPDEPEPPE